LKRALEIGFMEIDSIHFYVVNAAQTRDLLIDRMGLQALDKSQIASCHQVGAAPASQDTSVDLIGNSHLVFSISSPLTTTSPVAEYLKQHPSGVKDVSFRVLDLDEIRRKVDRMGIEILAVSAASDELPWLKIQGWGEIEHTIIRSPRSVGTDSNPSNLNESITGIDHLVLNVAAGELAAAVNWYRDLFDFQVQQTFDIQTQTSGLASQALVSSCQKIRFNINEPSSSNSQIQEFLDLNHGAGIQHIALQTDDLIATIDRLQQQELAFLPIPHTYYAQLQSRARSAQHPSLLTDREWHQLQRLQILMDWSASTPQEILLQIFTQPIFESPTFFFEFIERRNRAEGFGQGNFQALFEAIEEYNIANLDLTR
jgi:4-hydroxyphenylpyruvate dioxygenase